MKGSLHNPIRALLTALGKLMHTGVIFKSKGFFLFKLLCSDTTEDLNRLLLCKYGVKAACCARILSTTHWKAYIGLTENVLTPV